MNFELNEDQAEIKRTAHEFLTARFGVEHRRELAEAETYDSADMSAMVELGWLGIAVPENLGGAGLGLVELATIQEEMGYALAPAPLISALLAASALVAAGDAGTELLDALLTGEAHGSLGSTNDEDRYGLVPDAGLADFLVLSGPHGVRLHDAGDARIEPVAAMDLTRRFGSVVPEAEGRLLAADRERLSSIAALAVAAESVGVAQRAMEFAVAYASEREQFGHPIGAYQAIGHRCAQMLLEVESARSLVYFAAWAGDSSSSEFALAANAAKSYATDAAWRVPASAIRVHGGIGFTWEHDLHLFLKRGRMNAVLFGSGNHHLEAVADILLPATET
jgi:alkylation response protein AidB-like acyl-CoA dehydrogenase